jgi:hypothetical protein
VQYILFGTIKLKGKKGKEKQKYRKYRVEMAEHVTWHVLSININDNGVTIK